MPEIDRSRANTANASAGASGVDYSRRWFAVYTTPRHEKHVSCLLAQRQIETFLPLYRAVRQWKKRPPVVLELPLFPTYVFVRVAPGARGALLRLPGVLSMVGSSREPWPLPDLEIEALRSGLLERKFEPHPYLTVGEKVRIKAGVMAGVEGVLVRKKNDLRVVLSLDLIMRSIAVEVDADDVEPASNAFVPETLRPMAQSMAYGAELAGKWNLWAQ